ncbi:MAG: TcfC E-set like domain-containing protein [Solirubrobacterales bacterium]|nr:TcfC E-set like domain-containing protein [Solirubrobacterales bacterium]
MKKILTIAIAAVALLVLAQSAEAAQVQGELKVVTYGKGKVTAPGIECGSGATDCTETVTWDDSQVPPSTVLVSTGTAPGWAPTSWSGCARFLPGSKCVVDYVAGTKTATVYFFDVQAPNVFIAGYSDVVSESLLVNLAVSDNEQLTKVEFLMDEQVVLTQTSNFGDGEIDTSQLPEGVYDLQVRAIDGNRNVGESNIHQITVDHTAPEVELVSPLTLTNSASPGFTFAVPNGDAWNSHCAIQKQGETVQTEPCDPGEPFAAPVDADGTWEFVVEVSDSPGNVSRIVHRFVVDRTAPVVEITNGPAEGATLDAGDVGYAWSATDTHALTQSCVWDDEASATCDASSTKSLAPGPHRFNLTVTDEAGNVTTVERTLNVKSDEPDPEPDPDPDPEPDPDPDTSDRTAPQVRLTAPKQTVKSIRNRLRLNVRCDEACSGRVVVTGKRGVRFTGRVVLASAGLAKLRLRPAPKVRKRLASPNRARRSLGLKARAVLYDRAGNKTSSSLRFRVSP